MPQLIRSTKPSYMGARLYILRLGHSKCTTDIGQFELQDRGYVFNFFIKETIRGKGYGKLMAAKMVALARKRKIKRLWLYVDKNNQTAIKVYRSAGFKKRNCKYSEKITMAMMSVILS